MFMLFPCLVSPGTQEAPYELNAENRFTELENPFEEGVRLFEEGQIADAALCFEAEIARNPENSQVEIDMLFCLFILSLFSCSVSLVVV